MRTRKCPNQRNGDLYCMTTTCTKMLTIQSLNFIDFVFKIKNSFRDTVIKSLNSLTMIINTLWFGLTETSAITQ